MDPTGLEAIDLWFAAFIPAKIGKPASSFGSHYAGLSGKWFDEPYGVSYIVSTDNRSFGTTAPGLSRVKSHAIIDSDDIGKLREGVNYFTTSADATKIAAKFPFEDTYFINTAIASISASGDAKNNGPCSSELTIKASGNYPFADGLIYGFGLFVPNVDFKVTFSLKRSGKFVEAKLEGTHDYFPSYEGFAGKRHLYGFDAARYGFNLGGPGIVNLNSSIDFRTRYRTVLQNGRYNLAGGSYE